MNRTERAKIRSLRSELNLIRDEKNKRIKARKHKLYDERSMIQLSPVTRAEETVKEKVKKMKIAIKSQKEVIRV